MAKAHKYFLLLVQIATVAVFLGRAWQHLFWDAPYRSFFWDENLLSGIIAFLFSMEWKDYVTHPNTDVWIKQVVWWSGIFYLICAIAALFVQRLNKHVGKILIVGTVCLIVLAGLYLKAKFFQLGQLFEYTLQFSTPVFLYFIVFKKVSTDRLLFWMKVAIVLTFTCHGLYAIGYYPLPGNFVQMVMNITGMEEMMAIKFLQWAAIFDFIISILIFIPGLTGKSALFYAVFWGFGTSIARIWANFYIDFWLESLHQWTFEAVYRFPHFLIPLAVLALSFSKQKMQLDE